MKKEMKTSIDGLEVGMFVSRLDRSWIKTSFELEGLQIGSKADIEKLRSYCNFVYVDVDLGPSPHPRYWILNEGKKTDQHGHLFKPNKQTETEANKEYSKLRKTTYVDTTWFSVELKVAEKVCDKITDDFQNILADLQKGRDLDVSLVKTGISYMVDSIIRNPSAMSWMVQLKRLDEYTYSRALGTSVWCATFGRHLGLEKETINYLALGGLLLDLGKSGLPNDLLKKVGELNTEEFDKMRSHVDLGVKMLAHAANAKGKERIPMDVLQMVATHHERADGKGYPQGLMNSEIPLFGRIAGIVDSYDAITSRRPYINKNARPPHEAIAELYELRDVKFQTELVEHFIQTVGLYPTGSLIELSTGEVATVVAVNGLRRLRPSVMMLLDKDKHPLPNFYHIDLSKMDEDIQVVRGLPSGSFGIDMKELFL